jgi:hypothetical protein
VRFNEEAISFSWHFFAWDAYGKVKITGRALKLYSQNIIIYTANYADHLYVVIISEVKYAVTHNWPEKAKPERYQWKKPEWNKAESIRQKEQARIFIYRIGLRQNTSTEQGRNFYQ